MQKLVVFWKSEKENGYLSNWFPSPISAEGNEFPTAEHLIMFWKARFFKDEKKAQKILLTENPREAKAIGRSVLNYDESEWVAIRYYVDGYANYMKFDQNEQLRALLLQTEGTIVEASPFDHIWGAGKDSEGVKNGWNGQNIHGKVLVEIRKNFQKK